MLEVIHTIIKKKKKMAYLYGPSTNPPIFTSTKLEITLIGIFSSVYSESGL